MKKPKETEDVEGKGRLYGVLSQKCTADRIRPALMTHGQLSKKIQYSSTFNENLSRAPTGANIF